MSTLIHSSTTPDSFSLQINFSRKSLQVLKLVAAIGITMALCFFNVWVALAFIVGLCFLLSKDFISFIIYIFQLDFDLSKDIFKDLDPM